VADEMLQFNSDIQQIATMDIAQKGGVKSIAKAKRPYELTRESEALTYLYNLSTRHVKT